MAGSGSFEEVAGLKLLLDENLSPRLVSALEDVFPGSTHVRMVGLAHADDSTLWAFALAGDFVIVSKDSDFHQLSFLLGPPPKVVWIRLGNCTTRQIGELLREQAPAIQMFCDDGEAAFLALG